MQGVQSTRFTIALIVEFLIITYVFIKVGNTIRYICDVSVIRAYIVLIISGASYGIVINSVYGPIFLKIFEG